MTLFVLEDYWKHMSAELPTKGIVRTYVCLERLRVVLSTNNVSSSGRVWNRDALVGVPRATTELRYGWQCWRTLRDVTLVQSSVA